MRREQGKWADEDDTHEGLEQHIESWRAEIELSRTPTSSASSNAGGSRGEHQDAVLQPKAAGKSMCKQLAKALAKAPARDSKPSTPARRTQSSSSDSSSRSMGWQSRRQKGPQDPEQKFSGRAKGDHGGYNSQPSGVPRGAHKVWKNRGEESSSNSMSKDSSDQSLGHPVQEAPPTDAAFSLLQPVKDGTDITYIDESDEEDGDDDKETEQQEAQHAKERLLQKRRHNQDRTLPKPSPQEYKRILEECPKDKNGKLLSMGTREHHLGNCTKCLFAWYRDGCSHGPMCPFCHHEEHRPLGFELKSKLRSRYKNLVKSVSEKIEQDPDSVKPEELDLPAYVKAIPALKEKFIAQMQKLKVDTKVKQRRGKLMLSL